MATFAERLRELRTEKFITLDELAVALETTKATLSRYENSLREPKAEFVEKCANYFDVSVDYILGKTSIKNYKELFNGSGVIKKAADHISNSLSEPKLTKKDEKDITKVIEQTKEILQTTEGLMFDGEPASEEAIQSILQAMEMGMALAKQKNKEKYTPKNHRKDNK